MAEGSKIEWTGFFLSFLGFFSPNRCAGERRAPIKHSDRGPKLSLKSLRNPNSVYSRSLNLQLAPTAGPFFFYFLFLFLIASNLRNQCVKGNRTVSAFSHDFELKGGRLPGTVREIENRKVTPVLSEP